jgi:hypothetical protein
MPRPTPPRTPMTMPEVRPKQICRANRKGFARMLGLDLMPDECVQGIAFIIAAHRASQRGAEGHTPARAAAALRCVESRMRRGHDGPEATREITDPLFGIDGETFERLADIISDPETPIDVKIDAIAARRHEVESLPPIDARYALRVVLAAYALMVWRLFAVRPDDSERQTRFVLAILEAAGESVRGLRKNPERLKRDIHQLVQLTAQPGAAAWSDGGRLFP